MEFIIFWGKQKRFNYIRKQQLAQCTKEMVGWHEWLDGLEFEQAPGDGEGQGGWRAAVHGIAKSQTRLSNWTTTKKAMGFPSGARGQELACQCRRHKRFGFDPWVRKILWRRAQQPTPLFLPGESYGQKNLAGYVHSVTKSRTRLKWLSIQACKKVITCYESVDFQMVSKKDLNLEYGWHSPPWCGFCLSFQPHLPPLSHLYIIMEVHWLPFFPICSSALYSLTPHGAFVDNISSVY